MNIVNVEQGSPEWRQLRAGKVTASRISDVLAKLKNGGEAATRKNYRAQLVAETLLGHPIESEWMSPEMKFGVENECLARAAYEMASERMVQQVGFVLHPTIESSGCSPDGLVRPCGLIEIKVPNTATHLGWILAGKVPTEHQPQMMWQMACTGADWNEFVSFDPRLPSHLQLFVRRLERDQKRITEMEAEVKDFLAEVDEILAKLPKAPDPLEITEEDIQSVR